MKLQDNHQTVEKSSDFEQKQFQIATNGVAFEILSSKLYSDPIKAIIRELSTNAADAHRMAGRESKPFDVHMPTSVEPHFSIRDYGVSLTHDQVDKVYRVYFESLNRTSEETTGGFGLGSKSPFAYTDMFTVKAYLDGRVRTYSAFKEKGEPQIALLSEDDTDEADGLEIRMDVSPRDVYDFAEKAAEVYRFFEVRPNLTGREVRIRESEPVMTGDDWALYNGDAWAGGQISVVMGNVCYRARGNNHLGRNGQLVLFVPVGGCTPAVSREELQYDDETTAAIQERIDRAEKEILAQIKDNLQHCTTVLEKLMAVQKYSHLIKLPSMGKPIQTTRKDAWKLVKLEVRRGDKLFIGYDRWSTTLSVYEDADYCFVECDVEDYTKIKQKFKSNLRHMMNMNGRKQYYLAIIEKPGLFKKVFGEPAVKLTEIPDAPRRGGGGNGGGPRTFFKVLDNPSCPRQADKWSNVDADDVDPTNGIAIPREGYKVRWKGILVEPNRIYSMATSLGYTKIYGVPAKRYKKLCQETGLKDFETEAKIETQKRVANLTDFERAAIHHNRYNNYKDDFLKKIKGLSDACNNLVEFLDTGEPTYGLQELARTFDITIPDAENYLDTFRQRYPLIAGVDFYYAKVDDVVEYIQLKENN